VYEDVDWTPVNCESINRIFVEGYEREGCIRYWNFLTTKDMELNTTVKLLNKGKVLILSCIFFIFLM